MHRLQDAPFHYDKNKYYRWYYLGHLWDSVRGKKPDDDINAFKKSNKRTKFFVDKWNCKCANK